jgi:hypothetical protein
MSPYSYLFVFNLQIYFYHPSTLFIWHKCLFQPFISPHIPIAPVSFFRPIISLTYNTLYYFNSHLIDTPASASYTVPKFLPTRYPLSFNFTRDSNKNDGDGVRISQISRSPPESTARRLHGSNLKHFSYIELIKFETVCV